MVPYTIRVEGVVAAGKSTFLKHLQELAEPGKINILPEPVEKWQNHNFLNKMYNDPLRYKSFFQTYVSNTLLEQYFETKNSLINVTERSLQSCRFIFIESLKNDPNFELDYKILCNNYEILEKIFPDAFKTNLIIYLQTSAETALKRLHNRNRSEEQNIDLEYIKNLCNLYDNWLVEKCFPLSAPVLVIDANQDISDMEESVNLVKNIIAKTKNQN